MLPRARVQYLIDNQIPQATWHGQKKKKKQIFFSYTSQIDNYIPKYYFNQFLLKKISDKYYKTSWATREAEQLLFWTSFYQEFSSYIYYWILVISLFSHISVKVIVQEGKKAWKLKLQLCWNDTRETHYYHDTKIKDTVRKRNHRIKFLKKTNVLGDYMVVYICQNSKLPTWEGWVLVTLLKLYLNKFHLKKKKKKHRCKSVTKDKQLRNA